MPAIDLHIHSTASDGRLSPGDIIRKSAEEGLAVIALTDHDTVDGIDPALKAVRAFPWLTLIAGVEISTDVTEGEVHVLGYFINHTDRDLEAALEKMRNSRQERARRMVTKLHSMGCHIRWERILEIAGGGAIGRPHIAQAMLEKGYIESLKEAFSRYVGRDGPAYVNRYKVTPTQAVELVLQANGLPVMAHPLTVREPESMVINLKAAGLIGIEAYYAGYTKEDIERLVGIADRYGLVATGGTDYHGLDASTETAIGGVDIPIESVECLLALAEQPGLKLASL